MPKRIIGQCQTSDFIELAHISELIKQGEEIDLDNLTNREKIAVRVIEHFQKQGIPAKTLFKIKEVLVWDMGGDIAAFEFKLLDKEDAETAKILNSYHGDRAEI